MNKSEIKNRIKGLEAIHPSNEFKERGRMDILEFASMTRQEEIQKEKYGLNFGFFFAKTALAFSAIAIMIVVGWNFSLSPTKDNISKQPIIKQELADIENSWYLTDISPYLESIFQVSADDKASNEQKVVRADNGGVVLEKKVSGDDLRREIINEALRLNQIGGSLPALDGGDEELDEIINKLTI